MVGELPDRYVDAMNVVIREIAAKFPTDAEKSAMESYREALDAAKKEVDGIYKTALQEVGSKFKEQMEGLKNDYLAKTRQAIDERLREYEAGLKRKCDEARAKIIDKVAMLPIDVS
jgi:DNA repair photolyase